VQPGRRQSHTGDLDRLTLTGAYVAMPDLWLGDVALAIEIDSVEFHAEGSGFTRTGPVSSRGGAGRANR